MIEFNPNTQYVVRNDRTSYEDVPEEKRAKTADQIKISFASADASPNSDLNCNTH